MAPKAAAPPPKAGGPPPLPTIEDEVQLPEGVVVPDPPFAFAVAHVTSHKFGVEAVDGGIRDFEPVEVLLAQLRDEATELAATSSAALLGRSLELESLSDGGKLAVGLRKKAEAEAGARRRQKVNAARSSAIGGNSHRGSKDPSASLDFVLLVAGYPSTREELDELLAEGCFDLANSWVSVELSGQSLADEELQPGVAEETQRVSRVFGAPEVLHSLRQAIQTAEIGSALAGSTVCELPDSHSLALPQAATPAEGTPRDEGQKEVAVAEAQQVREAILRLVSSTAEQRLRFQEWFDALPEARTEIPLLPNNGEDHSTLDTRLYERLAGAIDSSHHGVPLLLYCLCEQVASNLNGDARDLTTGTAVTAEAKKRTKAEAEKELQAMQLCIDDAHSLIVGDGKDKSKDEGTPFVGSLMEMEFTPYAQGKEIDPKGAVLGLPPPRPLGVPPEEVQDGGDLVLPYLDKCSCRHSGDFLPGGASANAEVQRILSHLNAPGLRRTNFPPGIPRMSAASRSAYRNRIYDLLPNLSVVQIERLILLHEFERLLHTAQPERTWDLKDRVFNEKIPAAVLSQVLMDATRRQCFVDTAYVERQDCLLVAMHHRALPGRVLWHSWEGDLLKLAPSSGEEPPGLCAVPTFNDWWHLLAAPRGDVDGESPNSSDAAPSRPSKVLAADGRELGYCKTVEKLLVPSDGSIIIRTALQRGIKDSLVPLSADGDAVVVPPAAAAVPIDGAAEELGADSDVELESEEDGKVEDKSFHPIPLREMRSVRVVKDGLTFGMVSDPSWERKVERMRKERQELERLAAEYEAPAQEAFDVTDAGEMPGESAIEPVAVEPDGEEDEEAAKPNITTKVVEEQGFGRLWVAFEDGGRCTIRMHHERTWFPESHTTYDIGIARPGVQVYYTPMSGLVIQAFSDGSIRQNWPLHRLFLSSTSAAIPDGKLSAIPGDVEDLELSRTVTPFGVLLVEKLSGRREVYHPDGIRAVRNPTVEDIKKTLQDLIASKHAKGCDSSLHAIQRRLERMVIGWQEVTVKNMDEASEQAKMYGLPGHWMVTCRDGRRYGRVPTPRSEPEVFLNEEEVAPSKSPPAASPRGDAVEGVAGAEDEEEEEEDEEGEKAPEPTLKDILEGWLVDDGDLIEYEIPPAPVTSQRDPHTGMQTSTNEEGLLTLSDSVGGSVICVLSDGTRVIRSQEKEGYKVVIEKHLGARVSCHIRDKAYSPNCLIEVEVDDGSVLEVVPRRLNLKAELVPSDPSTYLAKIRGEGAEEEEALMALEASRPATAIREELAAAVATANYNPDPRKEDFCTNASVLLRRLDGTVLVSKGAGEVDIVSNFDVAAMGEAQALQTTQDRGSVYVAHVDRDQISMRDDDGNSFEAPSAHKLLPACGLLLSLSSLLSSSLLLLLLLSSSSSSL
ncbi:unnamed protein product [Polarella glacialis]|uniref:Uncharacterized protein n=1 Tax=Polarella glacialis TaxID=89957 RepID=A0A813DTS1_POLGL|nr:unnamed protein product [Polarella glacialis]